MVKLTSTDRVRSESERRLRGSTHHVASFCARKQFSPQSAPAPWIIQCAAPIAGKIGFLAQKAGNMVRAAAQTPLTTLNALDPVEVSSPFLNRSSAQCVPHSRHATRS